MYVLAIAWAHFDTVSDSKMKKSIPVCSSFPLKWIRQGELDGGMMDSEPRSWAASTEITTC